MAEKHNPSNRILWYGRLCVAANIAACTLIMSFITRPVLAVGPRTGVSAATADVAHPEVGEVGIETTFWGTGTKIGNNIVLTAAHAVNTDFLVLGGLQYVSHSNSFRLAGGASIAGLGIPHPLYDFQNLGVNDTALILTATPIPGPTATLVTVAPPLDVAVGNPITFVGFGGRGGPGDLPINPSGTRLTGTSSVNALTGSTISFSVPNPATMAGQNYTEPGDSGGPYFRNIGGNPRVVGVHYAGNSGGNPIPNPIVFSGQRITDPAVNSFVNGNGLSAADRTGMIINWADNTNGNFNSINWTSGPGITTPGIGHVVNINRPGAVPTVTVTADTPKLFGLLNDDRLDVTGGHLFVTLTDKAPGLLNGPNGLINVNANRRVETTAFDNVGTFNVNAQARLMASQDSFNSGNLNVTGGGALATAAVAVFNSAKGLRNSGNLQITNAGSVEANGFNNTAMGTIAATRGILTVKGNMTNAGTINSTQSVLDVMGNHTDSGQTTVGGGTQFTIGVTFANSGTFTVTGMSAAGTLSKLTAENAATSNTGTILASEGGQIRLRSINNNKILESKKTGVNPIARIVINEDSTNGINGRISLSQGSSISFEKTLINRGKISPFSEGIFHAKVLDNRENAEVNIFFGGAVIGEELKNDGIFLVTQGTAGFYKPPIPTGGGSITNNGTIRVGGGAAGFGYLSTNFMNNAGLLKIEDNGLVNYKSYRNSGTWDQDPSETYVRELLTITETGNYQGEGLVFLGGDVFNFSQKNVLFDMTLSDIIFEDMERMVEPGLTTGPEDIFDPDPSYSERNVSEVVWPSQDVTSPGGFTNRRVLYLETLQLITGPEDDPNQFTSLLIEGDPILVPHVTTLDVRGGAIYLVGGLSNATADLGAGPVPLDTLVDGQGRVDPQFGVLLYDSLDPNRTLSDIIRDVPSLPPDNFAIRSIALNGADYVVLIPEPTALLLTMLGTAMLAAMYRRRSG